VKFAFIAARDVACPVSTMCRLLDVTRSGFYAWRNRPRPARAKRDAHLAATVAAVHQRSRLTLPGVKNTEQETGSGATVCVPCSLGVQWLNARKRSAVVGVLCLRRSNRQR
jgi:hypothetical protein